MGERLTFLGIPYAAPPLGELRFRAPAEHASWSEPYEATALRAACPQPPDFIVGPVPYDEDCLTLNVWTPDLEPSSPAPVMVFIHGGGFFGESANFARYDGATLSGDGVVVVSFDYRLGPFGFLAHPSLTAEAGANASSGNYGLLDQIAALRWVNDNIRNFGGDPANVTIFGESAGALSVCALLSSDLATGLFHRAIGQSGACSHVLPLHDPGTPADDSAEEHGLRLASMVGCAGSDGEVARCLRGQPVDALLQAAGRPPQTHFYLGFAPNVDGYVLPALPITRVAQGLGSSVPVLTGANLDEGTLLIGATVVETEPQLRAALTEIYGPLGDQILAVIPPAQFASPQAALQHIVGDEVFMCPTRAAARAVSASGAPAYLYRFTQVTALGAMTGWGAFHGGELPFVFGNFAPPFTEPTPAERALSDTIRGYFTRFARTGDPNGGGAVDWPRYRDQEDRMLELGSTVAAKPHPEAEHCAALAGLGL